MAVFMVPYGPEKPPDSLAATLETATTDPLPLRSRCGTAAFASRTVCMRSTSKGVQVLFDVRDGQRAGVGHDGVQPAEPPGRGLDPRGERRSVPDVERDAAGPPVAVGDRLLGDLDLRGVAGAEFHDRALVDEGLDGGAADAAGAPRDEHPGAGQ